MAEDRVRHPREALDLTVRAVALRRGRAEAVAVLAAIDQAEASLHVEPDTAVTRSLTWVCRAISPTNADADADEVVVNAALRVAVRSLARSPSDGGV
ncbi:hypothetical protein [Actinomycetospora chibensis]|uniref:ANTAR domain-containing protein n=1 Tax=Actinomycetospora chibensis TaxID=663606 RepID=A0ABV9RGN4_9PSEU|nr:hypothetical protein [Actinomycetospora chibensis]MDD7922195.1 hypothetical protein [Actinomycetospora chibensis]